jgi:hypothetical protein
MMPAFASEVYCKKLGKTKKQAFQEELLEADAVVMAQNENNLAVLKEVAHFYLWLS